MREKAFPRLVTAALSCGVAALTVLTALPAQAVTYSLLVFPDQSHSSVYDFINSARTSIDVTMYELRDSTAVSDLVNREKAGVKVRVILDGQHTSVNGSAYQTLKAGGVGVTYSSSSFVYTHQKSITVDKATSLIMSGNLDSTYYANDRDYAVYDNDANDVTAIENVFNADYAKTSVTPSDGDHLLWSPTDSQSRLLGLINGATSTLDVEELEFGDSALVNAIVSAENRGVKVRVVGMDPSSYRTNFDKVVAAGGSVVTYSSASGLYVHAKAIIADGHTSAAKELVSSQNFSDNSLNHNRELGLIVSDPGVLSGLQSTFDTDFANGTRY